MTNIIKTSTKPRGLKRKASSKLPFNTHKADLVEPQEGQGIPVSCLKKHD